LPGLHGDASDDVAERLDLRVAAADQVGDHAGPAGLVERADRGAPLSPWKYSVKIRLSCQAGSVCIRSVPPSRPGVRAGL
jgi:hypothetical protein